MDLAGNDLLDQVEATWPKLGQFLRNSMIPSINNIGKQIGVSPVGAQGPPNSPQGLQVKVVGEYLHVAIQDNSEVQKGVQYFVHIANNPQFSQPIVHDYGASRTVTPHVLPTFDDSGVKQNWYVRAFSQYHGSQPSKPVVYGGITPTAIQMSGATHMTLLPSTGSGTGSGSGQSGAVGIGKVLLRTQPQPKRNVAA
jgi:hypothetical protein